MNLEFSLISDKKQGIKTANGPLMAGTSPTIIMAIMNWVAEDYKFR